MKQLISKFNYIIASLLISVATMFTVTPQALAASATLNLTPATVNTGQGGVFSVGININTSGNPVNAVQAVLSYPTASLDFVSITTTDVFGIGAEKKGGNGTVSIVRASTEAVTGTQLIASVKFKAKATTGSAKIAFTDASKVLTTDASGNNVLGATTGSTVNFKGVASSTATGSSSTGTAVADPNDKIAPKISNVKVADIKSNSATITWITSEPATSEVDYGLDSNYGLAASNSDYVTQHKVVLDSAILKPGTTFNYRISSSDPSGNVATEKNRTFSTAGLTAQIKVIDQESKPVSGATVKYQQSSAKTNDKGITSLNNLPSGKVTIVVSQGGKDTSIPAVVKVSSDGKVSPIVLKINKASKPFINYLIIGGALLIVLIALIMLVKRMSGNKSSDREVITPLPVVPDSDPDLKSAGPKEEEPEPESDPEPILPVKDNQPVVIKPTYDDSSDSVASANTAETSDEHSSQEEDVDKKA